MKKLLALLLALVMVLSFAACASESDSGDDDEDEKSETLTEEKKTEDNKTKVPAIEESKTEAPATKAPDTEESKTEAVATKSVVGTWEAEMPLGYRIEPYFDDDDLSDYIDFDDLNLEGITLEFKKNGKFEMIVSSKKTLASYDELLDDAVEGAVQFLAANHPEVEITDELCAELKADIADETGLDLENDDEAGEWEFEDGVLTLIMDGGDVELDVIFEDDEMYLFMEDTLFFICEK